MRCMRCEGQRDQQGAEFNKETALKKKTVPRSAALGPEASETPAEGQERKQSMGEMRGVLKNAASST